jgi:hypothetical protein
MLLKRVGQVAVFEQSPALAIVKPSNGITMVQLCRSHSRYLCYFYYSFPSVTRLSLVVVDQSHGFLLLIQLSYNDVAKVAKSASQLLTSEQCVLVITLANQFSVLFELY